MLKNDFLTEKKTFRSLLIFSKKQVLHDLFFQQNVSNFVFLLQGHVESVCDNYRVVIVSAVIIYRVSQGETFDRYF